MFALGLGLRFWGAAGWQQADALRGGWADRRGGVSFVLGGGGMAQCFGTGYCVDLLGPPQTSYIHIRDASCMPTVASSLLLLHLLQPCLQGGGSFTPTTDVICPMYARIPQLQHLAAAAAARGDPRPVMLCEYSHSMGNSTGNLDAYWRCFEDSTAAAAGGSSAGGFGSSGSSNSIIGGFIWDWADQCLVKQEVVKGQEVSNQMPCFFMGWGGQGALKFAPGGGGDAETT